jgi:hypothetical protein
MAKKETGIDAEQIYRVDFPATSAYRSMHLNFNPTAPWQMVDLPLTLGVSL